MKEFLNELARLWWIEVGTELTNPISEKSIKGLRKVLEEEMKKNLVRRKSQITGKVKLIRKDKKNDFDV